ncbi:hypothetical protein [Bdellovibrio sp. HCB337]|uniref:hypothetical protein n=1 Tax=Bdellovibrio sp. HCB337 TaxID=3394358 RepID=UPI0039A6D001
MILFGFVTVICFQNCAPNKKKDGKDSESLLPPAADTTTPIGVDCVATPTAPDCAPKTCQFDGNSLNQGDVVVAYQNSTVAYGSTCVSESRTCDNGALSGSYVYSACTVSSPASCLFNSQTIEHGSSVVGYQNSSVGFGSTCMSETRTCNNGTLSGAFSFASCTVQSPANCLFNGQTIQHNAVIAAFQYSTVPYGTTCQQENRVCSNGALSGSFSFASCNVEAPQSCLFNGQTVAHGQNVVAFQSSSVAYSGQCNQEVRTCDNGILSGAYQFASCNVEAAASCLFNGQTIADGQTVQAYSSSSVAYGSTCQAETRTCSNGTLSGSNSFGSCTVSAPANCSLVGQEVVSGSSVTAYQAATAPYGSSCVSESRICSNGNLSGSYQYLSCTGSPPPSDSCTFDGQTVLAGASVTAYQAASVPYGMTCTSESRTCTNGALSGAYTFASCTVAPAANCTFNGQTIANGSSVTAYKTATLNNKGICESQTRTCTNGSLSGSYKFASCN